MPQLLQFATDRHTIPSLRQSQSCVASDDIASILFEQERSDNSGEGVGRLPRRQDDEHGDDGLHGLVVYSL